MSDDKPLRVEPKRNSDSEPTRKKSKRDQIAALPKALVEEILVDDSAGQDPIRIDANPIQRSQNPWI